jgi:hypothetical protein
MMSGSVEDKITMYTQLMVDVLSKMVADGCDMYPLAIAMCKVGIMTASNAVGMTATSGTIEAEVWEYDFVQLMKRITKEGLKKGSVHRDEKFMSEKFKGGVSDGREEGCTDRGSEAISDTEIRRHWGD